MCLVLTGPVIRRRLALCMAAFFLLFTALAARLFDLQILQAEQLQRRAQAQWTSESMLRPTRGRILDRKGRVLAQSATAYTVCVSPRQVADAAALAATLSPILDMDAGTIRRRASDTSRGGVTLKRQVSLDTARQIRQNNDRLKAGFIINKYRGQTNIDRQLQNTLINKGIEAGARYLGTVRQAVTVKEAALLRKSLYEYAPKSNPAREYMDIFNTITNNKYA